MDQLHILFEKTNEALFYPTHIGLQINHLLWRKRHFVELMNTSSWKLPTFPRNMKNKSRAVALPVFRSNI